MIKPEIFPIYICSKARAGNAPLLPLLIGENIKAVLVVEPIDFEIYSASFPQLQILALPENGRGLPFSRQFALEHSRRLKNEWFWMLDDDIKQFYKVENRRCVPVPARVALSEVQELAQKVPNCAQAALEYHQFAWSSTKDFVLNSYADVAVLFNLEKTRLANFRTDIKLKGDREFTLQLLSLGFRVIRSQQFAFAAPKNGSNKGGLHDIYAESGEEEKASRRVAALYGEQIANFFIKPNGRPDVKINWRFFRERSK